MGGFKRKWKERNMLYRENMVHLRCLCFVQ